MRRYIDPFLIGLVGMLLIGLLVPIPGSVRSVLDVASDIAVFVLFLLYGARLSTHEVVAGLKNVTMQASVLATTFVLFPVLGLIVFALGTPILGEPLAQGVLYLTLLPSTVQSAVALVGVARGNVAGAVTAATISNVLGILVTPLLVLWLMGAAGSIGFDSIRSVLLLLLLPFVVGQLLQPFVGRFVRARKKLTTLWDRGTILLVVLFAVSTATASGVWSAVAWTSLLALVVVNTLLLAAAFSATWFGGRAIGLPVQDRITLLMCGSQKSLATGLPMAGALFPAAVAGPIAVPVIVFHQMQLIASTVLARRLAARPQPGRP